MDIFLCETQRRLCEPLRNNEGYHAKYSKETQRNAKKKAAAPLNFNLEHET